MPSHASRRHAQCLPSTLLAGGAGYGAAGTMWLVDPTRRFNFVFMSQFMPPISYAVGVERRVHLGRWPGALRNFGEKFF